MKQFLSFSLLFCYSIILSQSNQVKTLVSNLENSEYVIYGKYAGTKHFELNGKYYASVKVRILETFKGELEGEFIDFIFDAGNPKDKHSMGPISIPPGTFLWLGGIADIINPFKDIHSDNEISLKPFTSDRKSFLHTSNTLKGGKTLSSIYNGNEIVFENLNELEEFLINNKNIKKKRALLQRNRDVEINNNFTTSIKLH